ncbi:MULTISPECIES: SDR family NAD(P)-dependent oxidoreductase [unclassified Bradyrhizobium]|uniref:SDR family NAD(P)-dependent oxidoreductase n=1 Tax=unclassified Bradyrhizobium TaxID=2631580 RepID=UPI001BAAEB23|nr:MULTISPECIES: SDR family NAD(P)-dependent oxidoreductase [unclassified Bradyrhizobium]MBR1202957.1 SDR family NAD(P)-dependent oxidoreductase [Bradyrhizobium sp. AUGA SZCCT0124]MBR1314371.1 SDR family NAD(P)-dependent oxidoreductase [Bradyrhizobium sp. AUGA SZCCT0051]MBR1342611.1 SDR family NAD(P)-dependent oxidoreductase [Bradyrhizobium sp. AUGA SZCCT0105]MBR1352840.1 SDR family NAD(P)-dependent oxidoreductase [Bradyrhizobium sp. AUGA SZCCT0045]
MELSGKLAFITGAASGIGLALTRECVAHGMKVIMTDVETPVLERAADELSAGGFDVVARQLDVTNRVQYEAVAAETLEQFGAPYALFNNAGVAWGAAASTAKIEDWTWLINVNILGVANGLTLLLPAMISARHGGYVVNTGSITGLMTCPDGAAIYSMTKHAVVAMSETLAHELRDHDIHVTVICPGAVATSISHADRNRPAGALGAGLTEPREGTRERTREYLSRGLPPAEIARRTFAAMQEKRFYMISHHEYRGAVEMRCAQILNAMQGEPDTDKESLAAARAARPMTPLL